MALKQCPECSNQVSDQAKKCPHCGAPVNKNHALGLLIAVITAVIFIGLVVILTNSSPRDNSFAETSPTTNEAASIKYKFLDERIPSSAQNAYNADVLLEQDLFVEDFAKFIYKLGHEYNKASIRVWTDQQAFLNEKKNIYGKPFKEHFIAVYLKNKSNGLDEIRFMQEIGNYSTLFGKIYRFTPSGAGSIYDR